MCLCGQTPDSKNYVRSCCANELERQAAINNENRYFSGQMSKADMVRWDMERDAKANEQREKELAAFMEKTEKIKVAPAYMPEEFKKAWNELGGVQKLKVPANETPREELLQRDVGILFKENQELKIQNKELFRANQILIEQNKKLFESFHKTVAQNDILIARMGKNHADM